MEFFAIKNNKHEWYSTLGVTENHSWQKDIKMAAIFLREDVAKSFIESFLYDHPNTPIPKLIKFICNEIEEVKLNLKTEDLGKRSAGKCKFCKALGFKSDQGGIDGESEWEVCAAHKKTCPVRKKGHLQGDVTWVSLEDWNNFYRE